MPCELYRARRRRFAACSLAFASATTFGACLRCICIPASCCRLLCCFPCLISNRVSALRRGARVQEVAGDKQERDEMCVRVCARMRVPIRATLMSISGPPLFPAAPELMMPRLAFFSSLEMFSLGRCAHVGVTFRSDFSRRSHITSRGMSPGCTAGSHRRRF